MAPFRKDETIPETKERPAESVGSLWVMRASGGDSHLVTVPTPAMEQQVAWSPVGDRLAYITRGTLTVVNPDGTGEQELVPSTPGVTSGEASGLAWSPDGRWLAVEKLDAGLQGAPSQGLWRIAADGSDTGAVYLNQVAGQERSYLAGWSPDGHFLVFWQAMTPSASITSDGLPLEQVPATGGTPTVIVERMLVHQDFLSWSPDSRALGLVEGGPRPTFFNKTVAIASVNGGLKRLSDPDRADIFPAWSRDAQWLAFTNAPAVPDAWGGDDAWRAARQRRIWLARPDGSAKHALTADANYRDELPRWSADGQFILLGDCWTIWRNSG